jgi:hypothetical protein
VLQFGMLHLNHLISPDFKYCEHERNLGRQYSMTWVATSGDHVFLNCITSECQRIYYYYEPIEHKGLITALSKAKNLAVEYKGEAQLYGT